MYSRVTGAVFLLPAVRLCIMKLHRSSRDVSPAAGALCERGALLGRTIKSGCPYEI